MHTNRSRRTRVIVGGVATMLAVALAGCTADATGGEATPIAEDTAPASAATAPSATPSQQAEPEYSPDEQAAIDEAKAAVLRFYEVTSAAYRDPKSVDAHTFDSVAIDPVKTDRLGVVGYMVEEGEYATGDLEVEFAAIRSVDLTSKPKKFVYPEVFFDVCIDSATLKYFDASGNELPSEVGDRQPAALGTYKEPGQGWFVHVQEYKDGGGACKR